MIAALILFLGNIGLTYGLHGIAPTGRQITSSAMNTYRIHDNRIVEEWWQHDLLGVMEQLNAAPASPS